MRRLSVLAMVLVCTTATAVSAQTIYPLNRAEILAGSKFDFKVEFPGAPAADAVKVTINGRPAKDVLGTEPTIMVKEEDQDQTAFWVRDTTLVEPGTYTVEATSGEKTAKVTWEVYGTPARRAKNVILFVADGMAIAHRTAARIMSKGIAEGRFGGDLAMDDMPVMALVSTAGSDSIITDSANSASAYATGHKSCLNAMGIYCARNRSNLLHPKVEVISRLVQRRNGMAVGIVTNTEIEDATPAAMAVNVRRRADFNTIVDQFFQVKPDVMLGGGSPNFWPKSQKDSKRTDETDYVAKFKEAGYSYAVTKAEMAAAAADAKTTRLLGLFNTGNIDGALDRRILKKGSVDKFPDQPDLVDQTRAALSVLSKNPNGFFLMVESGRIDKYSHSLDWERSVFDTIMLDNAVKAAKEFAGDRGDTLIIVVPDHAHPLSLIGVYDDAREGQLPRDKLGIYADAKFPNYPAADADGYPTSVDVSRRLAMPFAAVPDLCFSGKPYLDGEFKPTVLGTGTTTMVANEQYCTPGTQRVTGNLPFLAASGVHSGDDVVLTAMGPGSELFRGRIDNTRVFRIMAMALGLAGGK
jgi:alkaline phosphatase